ncbi:MAG TPA: hypothetical protein VFL91_22785 [Thermomicrobiales bacterium]|nr:hypothetical protein [Thermomicrobiales bacterium]
MTMCESCGAIAPTKYVRFYKNIGMLVVRQHGSVEGNFCRGCAANYFRDFTLTTALAGWWSPSSLIIAPLFIVNNLLCYLSVKLMKPSQAVSHQTELTPGVLLQYETALTTAVIHQLDAYVFEIVDRLDEGEDLEEVILDVAARSGVTVGQVQRFITTGELESRYRRAVVIADINRKYPQG